MTPKLPLPSVCRHCHTTIHAALVSAHDVGRAGGSSRKRCIAWLHDADLATIIRRGGKHEAVPDPSYTPARARVVGPVLVSAVEATRRWRITTIEERTTPPVFA